MKIFKALGLATVLTVNVLAVDKVVYGDDNRKDLYEVTNSLYLELANSTAAMISGYNVKIDQNDKVEFTGQRTLAQRGICEHEKFTEQLAMANCSGFLVGEDLLVTAGHCIKSMDNCESYKWVFNYAHSTNNTSEAMSLTKKDVYGCKEIVERSLERGTKDDYALIRLDRKVEGRTPLKVRLDGKVSDGEDLVVIGHPTGIPTKIADDANVRNNSNSVFFTANLDTFGGNSGSAVFNTNTGEVEGILVRGETDYVYDWSKGCRKVNVCTDEGCRGEDVTRITNIKSLKALL